MTTVPVELSEAYIQFLERFDGNVDTAKRFATFYHNRDIFVERGVNISTNEGDAIQALFQNNGWKHFLMRPDTAVVDLVREFYCLIPEEINFYRFEVHLRGKDVMFSDRLISQVLEIPMEGKEFEQIKWVKTNVVIELCSTRKRWGRNALLQRDLKPYYQALNYVVGANLHQQDNPLEITHERAKLLYCIGRGIKFNLPKFMFKIIVSTTNTGTTGLPYGAAITQILEYVGVQIRVREERRFPKRDISHTIISRGTESIDFYNAISDEDMPETNIFRSPPEQGEASAPRNEFEILCQKIDAINTRLDNLERMIKFFYEKFSQVPEPHVAL